MRLRICSTLLALATTLTGAAAAATPVAQLTADRDLLVATLAGEFDNWAQVEGAAADAGSPAPDHVHAAFAAVGLEEMAGPLMYGQMAGGGPGGEVFRQRLYTFDVDPLVDGIVMTISRFQDEALVLDAHRHPERMLGVFVEDLAPIPGCDILWRREGDGFLGVSSGEPCLVVGGPQGEVQFFHRMELDERSLKLHEWAVDASGAAVWGGPDEPALDLKRCRLFRGAAVQHGADGAEPGRHDLELHDQGGRAVLPGPAEGESLELGLAQAPPSPEQAPVLALTVSRRQGPGDAEVVATVETDPHSSRLALDLGWLEVELDAIQPPSADLDLLATWLAGSFASTAQAAASDEYLDIRLRMAPIWTDRVDGRWLYVEQAVADYRDRPYRQRVYRLREVAPGLFESEVYTLPDPESAVGAWRAATPLADLGPSELEPRIGCSILMRRQGDAFIGGTLGRLCPSERRGADHATSEVRITADGMVSWDRGFAGDGSQVWGAAAGGYVFDRVGGAADPDAEPMAATEAVVTEPDAPAPPPPVDVTAPAAATTP